MHITQHKRIHIMRLQKENKNRIYFGYRFLNEMLVEGAVAL